MYLLEAYSNAIDARRMHYYLQVSFRPFECLQKVVKFRKAIFASVCSHLFSEKFHWFFCIAVNSHRLKRTILDARFHLEMVAFKRDLNISYTLSSSVRTFEVKRSAKRNIHFDKVHRINGVNILIDFLAWLWVTFYSDTVSSFHVRLCAIAFHLADISKSECETLIYSTWIGSCKWTTFVNAVKDDDVPRETAVTMF